MAVTELTKLLSIKMDNSFIKDISDSLTTNVHCSSLTIYPNKEVPLDLFLDEIKNLDFYKHGQDRGEGWSAVTLYGLSEEKTDHHTKYGIENPTFDWCLEEKAPNITNYFKNNFFKNLKYKRIRIMRLDPYGVIRPHSDNEKNSLLNAINIELGPKTPQWTILTQIGQQNLELWPGRVYLFNNYFYHVLYNHSNHYRYQIIIHADNVEELKEEFIRSREEYPKGVYIDNQSNIDSAIWFSTGRPRGTACINLPYIENTLEDFKNKFDKGLFFSGKFSKKVYIDGQLLLDYYEKWFKENNQTIETDLFCFWNKQKPEPVSVNYHESGGTDNNGYWTYTTDALVEYVSSNSNNVDFDLIIGPSTGTNLEQLSLTFDCNNMLGFNYNEESNKIHKQLRDYFRYNNYDFIGYEEWEKRTQQLCKKHSMDCHTTVNAKSPTRRFFLINPYKFIDKIYNGDYDYLKLDLVKNPEALLPFVKNKKVVINTSNIYGYIDMLNNYTFSELKNSWDRLMNVLKQSEYTYFIGEDVYKVNKRIWINAI